MSKNIVAKCKPLSTGGFFSNKNYFSWGNRVMYLVYQAG